MAFNQAERLLWLSGVAGDGCGAGGLPAGLLFGSHFVCQVILVDVADVVRSFGTDSASGDEFDIVEPAVGIVAFGGGQCAQLFDFVGASVVRSQREETLG